MEERKNLKERKEVRAPKRISLSFCLAGCWIPSLDVLPRPLRLLSFFPNPFPSSGHLHHASHRGRGTTTCTTRRLGNHIYLISTIGVEHTRVGLGSLGSYALGSRIPSV